MLSYRKKNLHFQKSYKRIEKLRQLSKFLFTNLLNDKSTTSRAREVFTFYLLKLNHKIKKTSKTKIVNRCILTNRNRGVFRPWGISRSVLRYLMQFGILPGYSKSVW